MQENKCFHPFGSLPVDKIMQISLKESAIDELILGFKTFKSLRIENLDILTSTLVLNNIITLLYSQVVKVRYLTNFHIISFVRQP